MKGKVKLPRKKSKTFVTDEVSVSEDISATEDVEEEKTTVEETEEVREKSVSPEKPEEVSRKPSIVEKEESPEKPKEIKKKRLSIKKVKKEVEVTQLEEDKPNVKPSEKVDEEEKPLIEEKEKPRKRSIKEEEKPEEKPRKPSIKEEEKPRKPSLKEEEKPEEKPRKPSIKEEKPEEKPRKPSLKEETKPEDKPRKSSIKDEKPRKPSIKDEEKPKKVSIKEEEKPEEIESVTFVPRKSKTKEDIEQDFNIQIQSYGEEDVSMKGKVKLPRKKSKPFISEEISVSLTEEVPQPVVEEETPQAVESEETPEESVPKEETTEESEITIPRRRKSKPIVEEETETVTLQPQPAKEPSPETHTLKYIPARTRSIEDIEQDFKIQLQTYNEEDVSMKKSIKLTRKKSKSFEVEEFSDTFSVTEQPEESKPEISETPLETVEEKPEEVTIMPKKPTEQPIEEQPEEVTLKPKKPTKQIEETTEEVTFKPKKTKKTEEVEQEFKMKPETYEEEEVSMKGKVKLRRKKSKSIEKEEFADTLTVTKSPEETPLDTVEEIPQKVTPQDEESTQEKVVVRRKKSQTIEKDVSETVNVERPREESPESVTFKPRKTTTKEDIEQDFSIELQPYDEEDVSIKGKVKLPRKKSKPSTTEESADSVTITKEVTEEEVPQDTRTVTLKKKTKKDQQQVQEEVSDEVSLKGPKTVDKPQEEETIEEKVKIKRKKSKQYEVSETSEETTIELKPKKPKAQEDTSVDEKVKLPKKTKPKTDESESETITIEEELKLPKRFKTTYDVEEVTGEDVQINMRKMPEKKEEICEEETLDLKIRRKSSVPAYTRQVSEMAELSITRDAEVVRDVVPGESPEGTVMFSICLYIAENEETLNLVEGERVIVLESSNPEWWYVRKHLTEEKGWVPAIYLRDEQSYNHYVQRKLHEKIDRLPIFQKPSPGDQVCAPKFVEKLQPKHVPDGSTVHFECQVEGNPRPQITWFRQTAIIKPSQDFQIYYDDDNVATLIIREVFPEDSGVYTCVAKNCAGFASSTTELTVEAPLSDHGSDITSGLSRRSLSRESSLADILEGIPPTFSRKPKALCVDEGSNVELECHLVAVPEPDIFWYFNDNPIKESENVIVTTESDMHSYISKVTFKKVKKTQEGVYSVVSRNREGEARLDITLKVMTGKPEKPQILEPLQDVTINEGESAVLSVQISGSPAPTVTWFKDGKPATNLKSRCENTTYTVTFVKTSHTDSGKYSVTATNPAGTAKSSCNLVVEKPVPGSQAPFFVERFQEKSVKEKGTLKLTAKVTGNPVPTVTWFRNNKPLLASPKKKELYDGENIVLEITNADSEEDAGDYKCVASNAYGTATHGARVTVDVEHVTFTKLLPEKVNINEREIITLECETSHTVSTIWQYNGKELSGMDHREVIQEGRVHKLVIKQPTSSDSGIYSCMVKDQKTSSNVTVNAIKPEFVKKLEDVEVKELQTAILEVEITSKSADVSWHKNGEILTSSSDKFDMQKEGLTRKLLIRNISVHDDGEYTCSLGDQESTAEVTVVELPPEIIRKLEDKKVTVDEKVTFDIELTKGDALVHWYKDNKEIQFNDNIKLTIDGKRQTLEIIKATLADSGTYSCEVGSQKSTAKLTVEKPMVTMITKLPEVTVVPVNTDSTLVVKLSQSNVEVKWLKNGKPIKPCDKFEILSEGATKKLIIKKVKLDDQDEYTCVAGNVKTKTSLKVEVIEKVPTINFDNFIKEYKVKKGGSVTFDVSFTATLKPTVDWFVNGNIVKKSSKVKSTYSESSASLTIEKVEEVDIGNYTIRISNEYGEASAELTLIMIELPGAPEAPTILEITDSSITVHWKAPSFDGNSPIKNYILEYHDKEEFMVWHKIETEDVTYKVTELVKNHEITFKVAAVNEAGVGPCSESTKYVKVVSPKGQKKPTVEEPLKDTTVGLGQTVSLTCVVTGVPVPEIKWLKDGKVIKTKNTTYENNVATFTLTDTTEHSEGTYTCRAVNDAGSVETNCKLSVQEVPRIEIDDNSSSQILRVKTQWKVIVKYRGYPVPKITWTKNGEPIEDDKCKIYYDEGSTTIAIYSVERPNSGTYSVTATNTAGSVSANLQLKVIDKPSKPIGPVVLRDMTSDSVELEWKPPLDDGGLEVKYNIEKCDVEKMVWTKAGEVRDITVYNVQKLQEDAEYMFRITAENSVGISDYLESKPVTVKCKYRKPSAPQGPLEISNMSDTSMTIAWSPPLDDGGLEILDYTVEKKETSKKAWQKVGTTKTTTIDVTELIKGSAYNLRIFARNRVGLGLPYVNEEAIIAGKRISPPSPPLDLKIIGITGKSATLQWSPPESNGGLELTGYVIEKQLVNDKWLKVVTLEPTVSQFCVENLREKSEYYFRVYAENPVGLSSPAATDLVSLETHATVPSPPTAPLEIRSLSANAVDVEWGVPETDGGSPLTGYTIAIRDTKKTMWMEVGRVEADVQKLTVRDLQENHEYLIRIFAHNEIGLSEPLESDEPYKVQKPMGYEEDTDIEETVLDKPSMSLSTETTTSWMKEAGMDADIHSYASGSLLKRSEYFFRIWYYARQLFK